MYSDAGVREQYQGIVSFMQQLTVEELNKKEEMARSLFMSQGITFTVYNSGEGIEKFFPFDIISRIITASEWSFIEKGIAQRLKVLNPFLKDIYSDRFILKDGIVPVDLIYSCPHFLREMYNFPVPHDIYVHIDPTNNCIVNELHVRLAVGRNFTDCSPVKGTYKGVSQHRLEVGVSVSYENGRITDEIGTSLVQHPVKNPNQENSYRKYIEMLQQQQQ